MEEPLLRLFGVGQLSHFFLQLMDSLSCGGADPEGMAVLRVGAGAEVLFVDDYQKRQALELYWDKGRKFVPRANPG